MLVGGGGVGVFAPVRVRLGASVPVGVLVAPSGASVAVAVGVDVGEGDGLGVDPGVTEGVPRPGVSVRVGVLLGVGVRDGVDVPSVAGVAVSVATDIVTAMRGEASRASERPLSKGRGLGCTRRTTSRYQSRSVAGSLPHPSGPS